MANLTYKYNISMVWTDGTNSINIESNRISSLVIDNDYINKNMAVIMTTINVDSSFVDKMILNKNNAKIYLTINKYKDADIVAEKSYIKGEFIYFIQDDINYTRDLDYEDYDNIDSEDAINYIKVAMGLIKLDFINLNRISTNAIYNGATKTDIILANCSGLSLLMQPLENDSSFDEFIIPPCESISKLIKYIDSVDSLYETPYIYFMSLEGYVYLLSTSGTPIPASGETYNDILINIINLVDGSYTRQGIAIDSTNLAYVIDISADSTSLRTDNVQDKLYNRIIGISDDGTVTTEEITIKDSSINTNDLFVMVNNSNTSKISQMVLEAERKSAMLYITKDDIDASIFTPNKRYSISNFIDYSDYDGQFLINNKKEIFFKEDDYFRLRFNASFRSV